MDLLAARLLLSLVLAFQGVNDFFATALTVAYRAEALAGVLALVLWQTARQPASAAASA